MSSLGNLNIQLSLDTVQFVQSMNRSAKSAEQFARNAQSELSKIERSIDHLNKTAGKVEFFGKTLLAGFSGVQIVSSLKAQADHYTELSNKIKLVSDSEKQHAQAMAAVFDISMKTAQSTQAVSAVYQSFAQNAKELGISQRQVADVTETISKAVAISGASAAEAQNSLTQFGQVLLMGKFRAQEYNSVMTQTPAVMQAIARGLGVTMAQLKAMSDEGKLTTDKIISGLERSKASVDELYGKTSTTVSASLQNLSTATEKWVGELDSSLGATEAVASAINVLANNLGNAIPYVTNLGLAFAGIKLKTHIAEIYQKIQADRQQALSSLQVAKANEAKISSELRATQAYIQSLQAQLNLARTESARAALSAELQAQTARETALIQAKTAATNQLAAAGRSANVLSGAISALGGPVGLLTVGLTVGATALYNWHQEAEQARERALSYADSIEQVKANLEQMTAVQTAAELVRVKQSIDEQRKALEQLRLEQQRLINSSKETTTVTHDAFGGTTTYQKSAKELAKLQEELTLKTEEVDTATRKLNDTLEIQRSLQAHQTVEDLKAQVSALFPEVEQSQIKVDGLNVSLGNLTITLPQTGVEALNFANTLGGIAGAAMQAAVAIANLNSVSGGQLGEKAQAFIEHNSKRAAIAKLRKDGKHIDADKLQAELDIAGQKFEGADYEAALKSQVELLGTLRTTSAGGKSGKSSKGAAKSKSGSKHGKTGVDYQKQLTDQLTTMENRLSELRANAENIALFGQISQYQEVNRLAQDIAENAEKYSHYSLDGLNKLKSLATSIDSENQKIAIAQFGFDNAEKLKAMEFELTLLGKTRQEQALIQYNHQLDLEAAKLKVGMTEENIRKLDEEIAKLKERHAEIQAQAEAQRGSVLLGIQAGWNEVESDVSDVMGNISSLTSGVFDSMADSLNSFVMTGKADFRSLATSILSDISKMIIKMAIFNSLKAAFGGFADGGFVGGSQSFAVGGYTGDGGKYQPAGIVHRGEYVITKEATARLGRGYLDYLNYGKRGFANGGGVAVPNVPMSYERSSANNATSNQVSININIDQHGNTDSTVTAENAKVLGQTIEAKVLEVLVKQRRAGGMFSH